MPAQAAVKLQFVPEIGLTVGASYYGYQNMQGYDVIDWEIEEQLLRQQHGQGHRQREHHEQGLGIGVYAGGVLRPT